MESLEEERFSYELLDFLLAIIGAAEIDVGVGVFFFDGWSASALVCMREEGVWGVEIF